MSVVKLTRRVTFSSGHRYWNEEWDERKNREVFGKWASPYNHGHNYVLWVEAEGEIDEENGMVVNIKWIDDVIKERVIGVFDGRSINDEVEGMKGVAPCLENLLLFLKRRLEELPGGVELTGLKLEETELLYGEWRKVDDMVSITRIYEFAASHRLDVPSLSRDENVRLFGKCNHVNGHGHNYVLEVTVEGEPDAVTGMSVDLDAVDQVVKERVMDRYDHKNLDMDVPELAGKNTTSEVVVQAIWDQLVGVVPGRLERVRLFETARNVFEVSA